MNANTRISFGMEVKDVALALFEGNPGVLKMIADLMEVNPICDPDDFAGIFGLFFFLDSHGFYGYKIWILRKDVCGNSLLNVLTLLRCCQMGIIGYDTASEEVLRVEQGQRTILNFKDLLQRLQTRLPAFGKNYKETDGTRN
jgi:hypothetical protein